MRLFALCVGLLLLVACSSQPDSETLLIHSARTAYITGENLTAEDLYQKYLQNFPHGGYRLEAWNRLYDISVNLRNDKKGAVPLVDAMLLEYASDPQLHAELLKRAAHIHSDLHEYALSARFWEDYIRLPGIDPSTRNDARVQLSKVYVLLKQTEESLRILHECRQDPDPLHFYLECQLESANVLVHVNQYEKAKDVLITLRTQAPVGSVLWSRISFLLADVYEHEHEPGKAREIFESILNTFPNQQVVKTRIQNLKK
jgi:tetratricopeptide (TPR) repeat protein